MKKLTYVAAMALAMSTAACGGAQKKQVEEPARCPLCVMAEKYPVFNRHLHLKPRKP